MLSSNADSSRAPILRNVLPIVIVLGLLSYGASAWLASSTVDGNAGQKLAKLLRSEDDEPLTTGSIGRAAEGVRLDPCSVGERR